MLNFQLLVCDFCHFSIVKAALKYRYYHYTGRLVITKYCTEGLGGGGGAGVNAEPFVGQKVKCPRRKYKA